MIDLTMADILILRQLEREPGSSAYDIRRGLEETGTNMSMMTTYRSVKRLYAYCAIEINRRGVSKTNKRPVVYYELSEAGQSSLDEMRAFLAKEAA